MPNGFGCALGKIQLILYAIYNDKGEPNKPAAEDVELGEAPALEKPSKSPNGNNDKGEPNKPAAVDVELGEAPALEKPSKSPNGNA